MEALVQLMDFYAGRGLDVLLSPDALEEPEKDEMYGR
jgi:hypothetical protein